MTINTQARSPLAPVSIEDYGALTIAKIVPLLTTLTANELRVIRHREVNGKGRVTLLRRIDVLLHNSANNDATNVGIETASGSGDVRRSDGRISRYATRLRRLI